MQINDHIKNSQTSISENFYMKSFFSLTAFHTYYDDR